MGKNRNNSWLSRKVERVFAGGIETVNKFTEKAANKVGKLPLHDQCKYMLRVLSIPNMIGQNRKADFLSGARIDYQNANKDKVVSVEEWLKEAHAEPLFQKILDKLKITWEELEGILKNEKP